MARERDLARLGLNLSMKRPSLAKYSAQGYLWKWKHAHMGEGGWTPGIFRMDEAVHLEALLKIAKCREVDVKIKPRMMRGDKL